MHISSFLSPRVRAAVLRGFREQLKADGKAYQFSIVTVCCEEPCFDFDEWSYEQEVSDDNAGAKLPGQLVKEAMAKEIDEYSVKFTSKPPDHKHSKSVAAPISTRW
eukprot:7844248-Pyramimonas_sp.AAC.1